MPRFDRTGPGRTGRMAGRGRGFFSMSMRGPSYIRQFFLPWRRGADYDDPRYDSPGPDFMGWRGFRRGSGRGPFRGGGFGFGRGCGRRW